MKTRIERLFESWTDNKKGNVHQNISVVWDMSTDTRLFHDAVYAAYKAGSVDKLDEDFADLLDIEVLKKYNPDGSDRWIVRFA